MSSSNDAGWSREREEGNRKDSLLFVKSPYPVGTNMYHITMKCYCTVLADFIDKGICDVRTQAGATHYGINKNLLERRDNR